MGKRSQASSNPTLMNYAYGLVQDLGNAIADFIAPVVNVVSTVGQFKKFDNKNAFVVYDTSRAVGGAATRIVFTSSDGTFNCLPQALDLPLDDAERDAEDAGNPYGLEESAIETLLQNAALSRENKVISLIKDNVTAEAGKGVWTSADVNPITELNEQIEAIAVATGRMPNAAVLGLGAWRIAANHPKVQELFKYSGQQVSLEQFASKLLNPAIQIKIGVLSKDTTKIGGTRNAQNVVGAEAFVFIRSENPTKYDASFAKTFRGGRGGIQAIYTYRADNARSDVLALDWSEDTQIVSSICGKRLTIT